MREMIKTALEQGLSETKARQAAQRLIGRGDLIVNKQMRMVVTPDKTESSK